MRTVVLPLSLLVVLTLCGCTSGDDDAPAASASTAAPVQAGPVAATELVPGDCVSGLVLGAAERVTVDAVRVVGCDETHELEVFSTFELTPADLDTQDPGYPGQQRIVSAADLGCGARLQELGEVAETVGLIAVWPTPESWVTGDRTVACAVYSTTGGPFEGRGVLAER